MAEGEKKINVEDKNVDKEVKETNLESSKIEDKKVETKEDKKESKKKTKIVVKELAIANGYSMRISPKAAVAICKVIKGKSPEAAVKRLEAVVEGKRSIPMKNLEVGHKKGKGIAGARFPKNACKAIIEIVKQVEANAVVNGIENPVITIARSDRANRPYRRAGMQAKRAHIHLEVKARTQGVPVKGNKSKLVKIKK